MYNGTQDRTARLSTTRQVAERLGISVPRVKQLATELHVGTKLGRDWLFTDAEIETMRRRPDRRRKADKA